MSAKVNIGGYFLCPHNQVVIIVMIMIKGHVPNHYFFLINAEIILSSDKGAENASCHPGADGPMMYSVA